MKIPTDVHNHDSQNSATGVNTESEEDRELNAFLSIVGTDVPVSQDLDFDDLDLDCYCDGGCDFLSRLDEEL
jgi:hypothetical protein